MDEQMSPLSPLGEEAARIHENFLAFVEGGFTEYQACVIIGTMFAGIGQGGRDRDT